MFFSFEEEIRDVRERPEIFMPEGIELAEFMNELDIRYKWRHAKPLNGFLVFFAIVWNVMLLPFVIMALASGQLAILAGISVHLAVGVGFLYHIISTLLNSTYIIVDDHEIMVEHRPLKIPFFVKDLYIPVDDVAQLYVKKYEQSRSNGRPNYAYAVHVKEVGGKDTPVTQRLQDQRKSIVH